MPLLLLFISCTVTKRLHRTGFHIQWHTAKKIADKQVESEGRIDAKVSVSEKPDLLNQSNSILSADSSHTSENRPENSTKSTKSNAKSALREHISTKLNHTSSPIATCVQAIHKISNTTKKKSKRPLFWRASAEDLKKIGIVLMSLGLVILLGSILVSAGAFSSGGSNANDNNGGNSGVWLNFFLDLIGASGWFWLLVFILIFVLVAYLAFLFVSHVLGGPLAGLIVGLSIAAFGLFFYILGKTREIEA